VKELKNGILRDGGQQLASIFPSNTPSSAKASPLVSPSGGALSGKTVLVTGGAGFIGSHLCQRLLEADLRVICLDNFDPYYDPKIKLRNIQGCLMQERFHLYREDIRNRAGLESIFNQHGIDLIVHLAAMVGVLPSLKESQKYTEVNIGGTNNLLELAARYRVGKFVFSSSSSIYGLNQKIPFSEEDRSDWPVSPYSASKRSGELFCYVYHKLYELKVSCLRFFTVYGPHGRPDMAPYKFARCISRGEPLEVYGDGQTQRDYTFITDIIDGIVSAMSDEAPFEIYNLGNSTPIPLMRLIQTIESALGLKAKIKWLAVPPGDVPLTYADITKARRRLNYQPKVSLEDGIRQFIQWFLENN
jgi:UDP-glucuronate 4-epimerase